MTELTAIVNGGTLTSSAADDSPGDQGVTALLEPGRIVGAWENGQGAAIHSHGQHAGVMPPQRGGGGKHACAPSELTVEVAVGGEDLLLLLPAGRLGDEAVNEAAGLRLGKDSRSASDGREHGQHKELSFLGPCLKKTRGEYPRIIGVRVVLQGKSVLETPKSDGRMIN